MRTKKPKLPTGYSDGTQIAHELLAEIERLRAENAELKRDAAEAFEIITQSEMQCRHPSDDGSDDCGNIDDCMYHALLEKLDRERFRKAIEAGIPA